MGLALYNGLKSVLNGKTLAIQFITSGNSSFDLGGAGIRLRMDVESGQFCMKCFTLIKLIMKLMVVCVRQN